MNKDDYSNYDDKDYSEERYYDGYEDKSSDNASDDMSNESADGADVTKDDVFIPAVTQRYTLVKHKTVNGVNHFSANKEQLAVLSEKIRELERYCVQQDLPIFISVAVANDEKKTKYVNTLYAPEEVPLTEDYMVSHMKVLRGFDLVLPGTDKARKAMVQSIDALDLDDDEEK